MKAMVALWHQGEGKGLVIETHDSRALVDEMKDNNKGYVVVGVKPIGQVDYALLKEVRGQTLNPRTATRSGYPLGQAGPPGPAEVECVIAQSVCL
jgi:hypothetical protein